MVACAAAVSLLANIQGLSISQAANSGGQPGQFMSYGAGARALGMGGAFFAVADDATASYWNPAGLAQLERKELTAMQATLFADTTLSFISYAQPTATGGTWAVNVTQLSSKGFEKISATFDPVTEEVTGISNEGTFSDTQQALGLAWGKQMTETISFGAFLKHIERKLDTSADRFEALDLAMMKEFGPTYQVALGLKNAFSVKSGDTEDKMPLTLRFGNALRMLKKRFTLGLDLVKSQSADMEWHLGGEYWILNWWALRFGLFGSPGIQETDFGFGFRTNSFSFDIAQGLHELGNTTRFSASFRFGAPSREVSGKEVKGLVEEGFEAFRQGNFVLAVQKFTRAREADPANAQVKAMLARLQTVISYVPQSTGPDETSTFVRKGSIEYVNGVDLKGAVNALRHAFNKNPKDEKVLGLLNQVEKEAGISDLTRKPEGPEIFGFIDQKIYDARQSIYDGRYDLAIRRAQDVLDLEPKNVTALEIMGSAFYLMDQKDKARLVWLRVMKLDPENKVVPQFLKQLE